MITCEQLLALKLHRNMEYSVEPLYSRHLGINQSLLIRVNVLILGSEVLLVFLGLSKCPY